MAKVLTLFFSRHLLLANTSIACLLYGSGDYLEQKLEGENLDGARTARFASLGLLFGPWEHYWYRVLDSKLPGKAARVVVYKVLLDQFLMSPAEYAVFYVGLTRMEGYTLTDGVDELKNKFWPTYKVDLMVWPLAQTINFYLLPPMFRMMFVNVAHLCWGVFLSYMKHK